MTPSLPRPPSPNVLADIRDRRKQKPKTHAPKAKPRTVHPVASVEPWLAPKVKPAPKAKPKPAAKPAPAPETHAKGHKPAPKPAPKAKPAPAPTAPVNITAALTPEQLDKETAAATRLRYGGQEREIAGQQRVSDRMQGNIGDWFKQYQDAVERARQRTADFNSGAQAAMAQQAQQAQAQDTALATTPEAQQAAAARRSTQDSFGAMLATQAGAENAYQADKGRIGAGEAANQHLAEAGRKRSLASDLAALKGEEGDYGVQYRSTARESERKNALEQAAFGLDKAKAVADVQIKTAAANSLNADRRADNRRQRKADAERRRVNANNKMEQDRQFALDKQKFGALQAKDNYQKAHGLGPYKPAAGPKGATRADKRAVQKRHDDIRKASNKALTRIDDVKSKWANLVGSKVTTGAVDENGHAVTVNGVPATRPITDKDIYAEMLKQGYSANEIHLARILLQGAKWGPLEIQMAHKLGIKVPRNYLIHPDRTIRAGSKKDPKPTSGQQNGLGGK